MLSLILFPFQFLISFILWITIWIPFYLLGFLIGWIGLLFCNRESEHMSIPFWFWDNSHGINGTIDGNNPKWIYLCNKEVIDALPENKKGQYLQYLYQSKSGNERTYKNRWIWCYWRNPVSNLSLYILGDEIEKKPYPITKLIGDRIKLEKVTCGFGWFYSFMFKYNSERCFYFAFGNKYLDPAENRARFIFRISPYREIPK